MPGFILRTGIAGSLNYDIHLKETKSQFSENDLVSCFSTNTSVGGTKDKIMVYSACDKTGILPHREINYIEVANFLPENL